MSRAIDETFYELSGGGQGGGDGSGTFFYDYDLSSINTLTAARGVMVHFDACIASDPAGNYTNGYSGEVFLRWNGTAWTVSSVHEKVKYIGNGGTWTVTPSITSNLTADKTLTFALAFTGWSSNQELDVYFHQKVYAFS